MKKLGEIEITKIEPISPEEAEKRGLDKSIGVAIHIAGTPAHPLGVITYLLDYDRRG